jgi:hypothetical protein
MKLNSDALIKEYIDCAIIQGEATLDGDYKRGNKAAKKLTKMYKRMEQNDILAIHMLDVLFKDDYINVKIYASVHALGLNIKISEAIAILKEISIADNRGILGFNAEMALKIYNKQGYLKFY